MRPFRLADGLQRTVNIRYYIPNRAALKILWGLRDQLPYFA